MFFGSKFFFLIFSLLRTIKPFPMFGTLLILHLCCYGLQNNSRICRPTVSPAQNYSRLFPTTNANKCDFSALSWTKINQNAIVIKLFAYLRTYEICYFSGPGCTAKMFHYRVGLLLFSDLFLKRTNKCNKLN